MTRELLLGETFVKAAFSFIEKDKNLDLLLPFAHAFFSFEKDAAPMRQPCLYMLIWTRSELDLKLYIYKGFFPAVHAEPSTTRALWRHRNSPREDISLSSLQGKGDNLRGWFLIKSTARDKRWKAFRAAS